MTTATLLKVVRIRAVAKCIFQMNKWRMRNLDRTLFRVRWQSDGDCVVFPEDLEPRLSD
jgi:hypothetical protein